MAHVCSTGNSLWSETELVTSAEAIDKEKRMTIEYVLNVSIWTNTSGLTNGRIMHSLE